MHLHNKVLRSLPVFMVAVRKGVGRLAIILKLKWNCYEAIPSSIFLTDNVSMIPLINSNVVSR